jgi:hypothetical protein
MNALGPPPTDGFLGFVTHDVAAGRGHVLPHPVGVGQHNHVGRVVGQGAISLLARSRLERDLALASYASSIAMEIGTKASEARKAAELERPGAAT